MKTKLFLLIALLGIFLYSCDDVADESAVVTSSSNQVTVTVIDTIMM